VAVTAGVGVCVGDGVATAVAVTRGRGVLVAAAVLVASGMGVLVTAVAAGVLGRVVAVATGVLAGVLAGARVRFGFGPRCAATGAAATRRAPAPPVARMSKLRRRISRSTTPTHLGSAPLRHIATQVLDW
jgi:hypothetical protein